MYIVYILYSSAAAKTYVGYTNNISRRLTEHNLTETKGFTLRYRPWILIWSEQHPDKTSAMAREKFLKTGKGREEIKDYIKKILSDDAVSAAAEKD